MYIHRNTPITSKKSKFPPQNRSGISPKFWNSGTIYDMAQENSDRNRLVLTFQTFIILGKFWTCYGAETYFFCPLYLGATTGFRGVLKGYPLLVGHIKQRVPLWMGGTPLNPAVARKYLYQKNHEIRYEQ